MSSFFSMDSPVMRFLSRVCDLIILNLLAIVCSIPIVTIGASITAVFSVTLKMVKGEESYIVRGFFKGFKENFKQATIIWVIMAVIDSMRSIFQVLIGAVAVIYLIIFTYLFPYLARFQNSLKNIFKNSLLIAILNLPWTLLMIVCPIALVVVTFLTTTTLVYGSMLWVLMGFAVISYFNSITFRKVFAKYEPHNEEEEVSDSLDTPEELPEHHETPAK